MAEAEVGGGGAGADAGGVADADVGGAARDLERHVGPAAVGGGGRGRERRREADAVGNRRELDLGHGADQAQGAVLGGGGGGEVDDVAVVRGPQAVGDVGAGDAPVAVHRARRRGQEQNRSRQNFVFHDRSSSIGFMVQPPIKPLLPPPAAREPVNSVPPAPNPTPVWTSASAGRVSVPTYSVPVGP